MSASEKTRLRDAATGATVIQWTGGSSNNQHLYFTSPSVTADDRWLVFMSDRSGHPNVHAINRATGEISQLSENRSGLRKSYVYPRGGTKGLSKSSPCLDPDRARVCYVQGDSVCAVDLRAPSRGVRRIAELPAGWCGAFTHVSPDGRTLCVPCTDGAAFVDPADTQWAQMRLVPGRMERENLRTRIYLIDVESGGTRIAVELDFWVTHVQFDPAGSGRVVFNREGFAGESGVPPQNRIWCLEPDGECRPLSAEPEGEWRSHENWAPDGSGIIYHGGRDGRTFVAVRAWDGALRRESPSGDLTVYHATGAPHGRLLADRPDGFISLIDPWSEPMKVRNLCRHDTEIEEQDAHAHPIATARGESAIFTSNRSGRCQVYEVIADLHSMNLDENIKKAVGEPLVRS